MDGNYYCFRHLYYNNNVGFIPRVLWHELL